MGKSVKYYVWRFILSIVVYVAFLALTVFWLPQLEQMVPRLLVALLPVVPTGIALFYFVKAVAQFDEFQRRLQFEAVAFSFGGTAILTFGYGFLEIAGLPHLSWLYVMPLMVVLWGVGQALALRRYQ